MRYKKGQPSGSNWIWPVTRMAIWLRDGLACAYCLQDWSIDGLTIDHIVPRVDGGKNEHTNLISACMRCNGVKRFGYDKLAIGLGVDFLKLQKRISAQATPLTVHLRLRARHLVAHPTPWMSELKSLNTNYTPQLGLSIIVPASLKPVVYVKQQQAELPVQTEMSDDSDIPF